MFGRNDFLGEVTLPLADVVFDDPAPTWHKLHERVSQAILRCTQRGLLIRTFYDFFQTMLLLVMSPYNNHQTTFLLQPECIN